MQELWAAGVTYEDVLIFEGRHCGRVERGADSFSTSNVRFCCATRFAPAGHVWNSLLGTVVPAKAEHPRRSSWVSQAPMLILCDCYGFLSG